MSKVKIQGNASGTGVLTVTAPNTSTDRTITLPDSTGTLLTADGDGSNLTGVSSVGGATGVDFNDSIKARFGTGNDLEIYHDGTNSIILDGGTGDLCLRSNDVLLQNVAGDEKMLRATPDDAVYLYFNNAEKIKTTATGVTVTGAITETDSAAGTVLQIVPFTSSTATNVTTSGTWTTIVASAVDITSKQANSKFLYYFDMSVETDVSATSTYNFGQLARSGTRITASQQTLSVGHDSYESSPTTVFTYTDVPSAAAGTTITYAMMLNASNSASFQINQPSLAGQEGGTSIHSNGYVMEIAV